MNKTLIATLTIGLLGFTGTASAHGSHLYSSHTHQHPAKAQVKAQAKTSGAYFGAGVGKLRLDVDPGTDIDDTAHKVFGGYQLNKKFAVELQHAKMDGTQAPAPTAYDVRATSLSAVITPFNSSRVTPFAKIGVSRVKKDLSTGNTSDTGISGGLGLMYSVNKKFKVRAEYEKFDSDTDMLSIGGSYHF
ncbi:MAG: porin family protein [Thiotrichaceae bacterium]|nr:porin family protein [Thiotrichaceae bacterium]